LDNEQALNTTFFTLKLNLVFEAAARVGGQKVVSTTMLAISTRFVHTQLVVLFFCDNYVLSRKSDWADTCYQEPFIKKLVMSHRMRLVHF